MIGTPMNMPTTAYNLKSLLSLFLLFRLLLISHIRKLELNSKCTQVYSSTVLFMEQGKEGMQRAREREREREGEGEELYNQFCHGNTQLVRAHIGTVMGHNECVHVCTGVLVCVVEGGGG